LRAAIGASRAKIIRQLLVESLVLSICGGTAGVALAFALLRGMVGLIPREIPRIGNADIDVSVLAFVVLVSVITGLLFGVLPAWRMSQLEPVQALREGTRGVAGGRGQHRLHTSLVIMQTATGLVLLVGAGLLIRSFVHILNLDPGFDPKNMLTARIGVSFDRLGHDQHVQFYDQLVARISALPAVQAASAGWPLPMSGSNASVSFSIEGNTSAKADHPSESISVVLPGYFKTMRVPLLSGRFFGENDGVKSAPVIIINQAFTNKYFPSENPIGKRIRVDLGDGVFENPAREIVGVVGDIRRKGLPVESEPAYYLPYAQAVVTNPFLTIRTGGDPFTVENELRAVLHDMDKSVPLYQVSTLESYVSKSVAQPRFQTLLLCFFGVIALILSAIGLYGLLSYTVAQRTLEIGLRMALGAQRGDVLRMIVRRGLTLALVGLGAGLAVSAMTTRLLSGMLYGIRPFDPVTFAAVPGVLLFVSLAASSLPAYRAARLDPVETLREQ